MYIGVVRDPKVSFLLSYGIQTCRFFSRTPPKAVLFCALGLKPIANTLRINTPEQTRPHLCPRNGAFRNKSHSALLLFNLRCCALPERASYYKPPAPHKNKDAAATDTAANEHHQCRMSLNPSFGRWLRALEGGAG